jgi:hypothetical protein
MTGQFHPYHLVNMSPWPLVGALGAFCILVGIVNWFYFQEIYVSLFGFILLVITSYQ